MSSKIFGAIAGVVVWKAPKKISNLILGAISGRVTNYLLFVLN